jgi:hypothetical protein
MRERPFEWAEITVCAPPSACNLHVPGVLLLPAMGATITLFRPVGERELELIRASGMREFPPRLPGQPIFYPVLNEAYATEIARDWNTKDAASGYAGYVTRFEVRAAFLCQFQVQTVGASRHQEYWIPAERLSELNSNIVGLVEVISEFKGTG